MPCLKKDRRCNHDTRLHPHPKSHARRVQRYIEKGIRPGEFLCAVISNDLKNSVGLADFINKERLPDYVTFFYSYAPAQCWGSPEKMEAWIKSGGLKGIASQQGEQVNV